MITAETFEARTRRMLARELHDFSADYPPRLVTKEGVVAEIDGALIDIGANLCDLCGALHRVWITDDALWALVPVEIREKRICVECFKEITNG